MENEADMIEWSMMKELQKDEGIEFKNNRI